MTDNGIPFVIEPDAVEAEAFAALNERIAGQMTDEEVDEAKYFEAQDEAYRATLTPQQLLNFMEFNGEVVNCADCKLPNVEVVGGESHADYVGHVHTSILACGCQILVSDGAESVR
jgi:hypothetical protein